MHAHRRSNISTAKPNTTTYRLPVQDHRLPPAVSLARWHNVIGGHCNRENLAVWLHVRSPISQIKWPSWRPASERRQSANTLK
jgi:hypothetical protein